ncbi:hypothetical protein B1810_14440 [Panacagrimonas perspica]|nr:hypothetical protein B1810_14440 [Panacagrimonas perspica]
MRPNEQARLLRAAKLCRELGIHQEKIAADLGASQSQISRVLSARGSRFSRLCDEVCAYVERSSHGISLDAVRDHPELIGALRDTWDGSPSHAKALAAVIRSLAALHVVGRSSGAST